VTMKCYRIGAFDCRLVDDNHMTCEYCCLEFRLCEYVLYATFNNVSVVS